ncbi:GDSl lipase/esterase [Fadolivirus algeromassiliense]|jgi:hypothetical protein|uniref:GDSl lipase/esterase n=1 Tax=Fadolivirus FV1/VV64 TaxID=3070911 RepID=A0A7D3QVA1_9VIRU|nr:GDSl lipase/esterase [Fadolivirus algeromassiliense]QKF94723.1 GDSl lipase/esterase [Fadolivirus FV1/VV64]
MNEILASIQTILNQRIIISNILNEFKKNIKKIKTDDFYRVNESLPPGHYIEHLELIYDYAKSEGVKQFIWFAGDSSLDNKCWIKYKEKGTASHIYNDILTDSDVIQDVAYHLNTMLPQNKLCINTSIEATKLGQRKKTLLDQDEFIRDHVRKDDILIISVGGNDIAFGGAGFPYIQNFFADPTNPKNFDFFEDLFHTQMKAYLEKLISKQKPKKIIVCIIYMPNLTNTTGWADGFLSSVKQLYPGITLDQLTMMIKQLLNQIHDKCVNQIKIGGTEIIPLKLYDIIDGSDQKDYEHAVEPSVQGGKKMAQAFYNIINK